LPLMDVVAEFQAQIDAWATTYAGRPREELRELWLVGLEREKLVTVAYNPNIIQPRLIRMGVPENIRDQVVRAIGWAWRDEEMHAVYIRGTLLHESALPLRLRTWMTHASGHVAGWTSSRQQHYRWREAPLTRTVAELIEYAGVLGGQVPQGAREHLHFDSFRAFCLFSVAAETTAAIGWARMAEVGKLAGIRADDITAFLRMEQDELRHAAIFTLLADVFDGDDKVHVQVTESWLRTRIGEVGQRFLATPESSAEAWNNPIGKGAVVYVHQGNASQSAQSAMDAVLDRLGIDALLAQPPRAEGPVHVAIRATFMHGYHRKDRSSYVSPELLSALAKRCVHAGARVTVLETPNVYDRFFRARDVHNVAKYLGFDDPNYTVVDVTSELEVHPYIRGQGRNSISRSWRDADVRIAFGKLRGHPVTDAMLTLEAVEGLNGRHDDTLWGDRRADRTTANLMTLDAFPPDLVLLDAWRDVPDGLLGMIACTQPRQPFRLYGSTDPLSLDVVATEHIGGSLRDHKLMSCAVDWFGDPRPSLTVVGENTPISGWRGPDRTHFNRLLSHLAEPVFVHASGRGAAFVPDMDTRAFPHIVPPSAPLRLARAVVRRIIGQESVPEPDKTLLPTQVMDIRGHKLRMATVGQGPPIVFLHGYPDTLHIAGRLALQLADSHTGYLFDWPGTGKSEPWGGLLHPDAQASRLRDILDAWGLDEVVLVGSDMGAPPALCFAARYPERVRGVAVMNSLLFDDEPTSPEIRIMRKAGLSTLAFMVSPRVVYRQCKATFLPSDWTLPNALDDDLWTAFSASPVRRHLAKMCRDYERALPTLPRRYDAVKCPVLALWGDNESHFHRAHGARLIRGRDNRQLVDIQEGGHWMAWTHTTRVATALSTWLEGL
jgi:pimeloyl-ACP methyl ester carboxylesterase